MDAVQWQVVSWPDQRFTRQEAHPRGYLTESTDAVIHTIVFHTDSHPDVGGPLELVIEGFQALAAFGEYLECVLRTVVHRPERALNKLGRHGLVKEVTHGIDKNTARRTPSPWGVKQIVVQRHLEPIVVTHIAHRLQPARHPLGVAVRAAVTNLGASRDRIPRGLRPLD